MSAGIAIIRLSIDKKLPKQAESQPDCSAACAGVCERIITIMTRCVEYAHRGLGVRTSQERYEFASIFAGVVAYHLMKGAGLNGCLVLANCLGYRVRAARRFVGRCRRATARCSSSAIWPLSPLLGRSSLAGNGTGWPARHKQVMNVTVLATRYTDALRPYKLLHSASNQRGERCWPSFFLGRWLNGLPYCCVKLAAEWICAYGNYPGKATGKTHERWALEFTGVSNG